MKKLARKAFLACIGACLLLVAAGYAFRMGKERAVNHYVQTTYAQKYSLEYVGGYFPDDTQTYAVRLDDTDEPTFWVVLQGKEVIEDTYLLECMAKEMMQDWADALYTIWGPCSVRLRLHATQLSKTPLPEEAVAKEQLMKTKEFLASWSASMGGDATWSGEIVCVGSAEEAGGFCLDANGQMQALEVSANVLRIMETNALQVPLQQ